jgi:hypothetical protein
VYEKPTAPASIGGVLDDGMRLWRTSLSKTWGFALLAQALTSVPAIIFAPPVVTPAANLSLNERLLLMAGQSSRYSIAFLVFFAISYIFRNAVMVRINSIAVGSELTFGQSLSRGLRLTPRTWGMGILIGLTVALFTIVVVIIGGVFAAVLRGAPLLRGAVLGVGSLAAVGFILYISIKFVIAYPALVVDDLSATKSIDASWKMTRDHWWRIGAIMMAIGIIAIALGVVLAIVGAIVGATLNAATPGGVLAVQLTAIVVYSFLGSFSPAMLIALYDDLKLRSQGADLAGRVSALASR